MRAPSLACALVLVALSAVSTRAADAVRVDLIVTDSSGRTPDNLKVEDFQVLEEGTSQPIDAVRFVKADGQPLSPGANPPISSRADEQAAALRDEARLFAIFIDEYHLSSGENAMRTEQMLARFVNALGPRDLIVVMKPLDSLVKLRLSDDHQAALDAIGTFEGRKGDYVARNGFESNYIATNPVRIDSSRAQIVTSALNALAVHLGALSARRKTIVLVSEGFTRAPRRRGDELLPTIDTVIRSANRRNVSIYSMDPSAIWADSRDQNGVALDSAAGTESAAREALRALADETNGSAMVTAGDVDAWTRRIMSDSSAYYLLDFQPAHGQDVGVFHPIGVRTARKGVTVRARRGYWTSNAEEVLTARLAVEAAVPKPPPEPPLHPSPLIRPWFGMARGEDGQMRVSFVWQPAARVPGDRTRAQPPARVAITAVKDGQTVFEGVVRPSAGLDGEQQSEIPAEALFDVTPGRMRVQMAIQDESARLLDTDVRDVVVGSMIGQVALGTAQVLRARNAREFRELAADADAAPIAERDFNRTERLLVRIPAYAAGGNPAVSARLFGRAAVALRDLSVGPAPAADEYQIDLPLAGLANGDYAIEFAVASPAGEARESVPFRVTP